MVSNQFIRLPQVLGIAGISRSGIYSAIKAGTFPAPIKLGARAVAWLSSDLEAWVAGRVAAAGRG